MKKLIPEIHALIAEHGPLGLRATFHFDPYYVVVRIKCELPYLPSDCEIQVGIRNSLSEKSEILAVERMCDEDYVILDDLREKILKNVKEFMVPPKGAIPIEEYFKREKIISAHREAVMKDYCTRYGLDDKKRMELHMFFSPNCIVAGLTEEEVKICIEHYPLRRKQMELYPMMVPPFLHPTLMDRCDEELPRGEGLRLSIEKLLADLETKQPIINS